MTLSSLLLDLDGTVIDTHELILDSWRHVKAQFGLDGDDQRFREGIGRPLEVLLAQWARDDLPVAELAAAYRAHNDVHHDAAVRVFPGMPEVFERARRRGVPIAIVTSKSRAFAERGLRVVGLRADLLVGPTDAPKPKPAPDPVWYALKALGDLPASGSLFVGDAPTDLIAGKAAGVPTGAAAWGPFARAELLRHEPDYVLDAPEALLPWL